MDKKQDKIREMARVRGLLVAATPAVDLGKLRYRKLEAAKIAALQEMEGDFNSKMTITNDMKTDLTWWPNNISVQDRKLFRAGTEIYLYRDTSCSGWGVT